jgi:hypothetical protein
VVSVSFTQNGTGDRAWDWPLDLGFLADPASQALRKALEPQSTSELVRLVEATTSNASIDLLLLPGSLAEALSAIAVAPHLPPVHTVLALGGTGRTRDILASLAALRAESGALASGVAEVPLEQAHDWLDRVLTHLSHDRPLDEALFNATGTAPPPILVAPSGTFAAARTSRVAEHVGRKLSLVSLERANQLIPTRLLRHLDPQPAMPLHAIAKSLRTSAEALDWHSEREAATELSRLSRALPRLAPPTDGRFVQARMHAGDRALDNEPLVPGQVHRLDVRIAHGADGWLSAPERFPDEKLPPCASGHELTVVLTAPSVLSAPQSASLWLPAQDDSEACSFHFLVPEKLQALDARVTILFQNRILQTLRIQAGVGVKSEAVPNLSITLESVLRARLDDISGAPGFDAAILLNDLEGSRGITAFAGAKTAFVSISSNLDGLVKSLRDQLEEIKKTPEDFTDPRGEATVRLLVTLARAGSSFLGALRELPGMHAVLAGIGDAPGRIQVMSLHPDEIVPLEFIYDRPFPKPDAELCQGMAPGGSCGPACSRDNRTLCPLGFWGLRHVIERRLYDETIAEELQQKGASFAMSPEAGEHRSPLPPLRSVLFASADRAAAFDKTSFDKTIASIEAALRGANTKFVSVREWSDWTVQVKELHPDLLLLLPHTQPELGAAVLEIGKDDHLAAQEIEEDFVRSPPPEPPVPGPVVFLFGCRTSQEDVPFSSFVGAFRRARASVIVATMSTVRGRHMAPVAEEATKLLLERAQGPRCTVGDLVRELRLRLLNKGLPVGLTLVAFGEVDWQIGGVQ